MNILQIIIENLRYIFPWVLAIGLAISILAFYANTRENSGTRGLKCYLGHLAIIGLGWLLGKWFGILLITLPILIFYYYMLFHLAMVVVPVSDPDNWQEWWKRFLILLWYHWGVQYPIWMVTDSTGQNVELRIPGDSFGWFQPGMVWARSHQVVSLTTGMTFSGIRELGTIFTQAFERPYKIVDLRTQLRTSWIEVISSDGILYDALLFTSFAVDKEKWDRSLYHRLYLENQLFKDGKEPDYKKGSYHFSRPRMRVLLSTIGVSSPSDDAAESKTAGWDQRALYEIEKAAREVLSQRRLDELWQPKDDYEGANAIDEIASDIRDRCSFQLKQRGIHLYVCRIINLKFSKETQEQEDERITSDADTRHSKLTEQNDAENEVEQKQIVAWGAEWQREAEQTRAQGKAEADILMQEARAYAYTNMLTAIAEGLQEARLLHPHLPRYVIAVRFISALEKLTKEQPEIDSIEEARASINHVKKMISLDMDRE